MSCNLCIDFVSSYLLPDVRQTDWIRVSVRATLWVLPSQASCSSRVLLRAFRAASCLPNFDWTVAWVL